jgi:hypothetical protein
MAERVGSASIAPTGEFEAGSFHEFTLTYTAGFFGIDDTGSLKIVHRFASDIGKPQFDQPAAANYVTVEASNGAELHVEYDGKRNVRPWDKTLFIRVVKGFLRQGDRIVVRFGDRRQGSPGMRMQTFHEPTFEFKVLVDPWATYTYVELPNQPIISIVAGPPVQFKLVAPTQVRVNEPFRIGFKGEDKWGNPSHRLTGRFHFRTSLPVHNLPDHLDVAAGTYATALVNLICAQRGVLEIDVFDKKEQLLARSNPIVIEAEGGLRSFWADLHGQSEETIGTNSARDLFVFARDRAFVDAISHQGNDFQVTREFWTQLNELTAEFNENGRFVVFPGYEWSGNTGLGGDRNVLFANEGETIHRSNHALVEDLSDCAADAYTANDLFARLAGRDCFVFAHVGGRYADMGVAHQSGIEHSIEIHSDWGTFEWLLNDAFKLGYRVGILANSDGHKGRHGASHPGASLFGAYGGLSCIIAAELTRPAILDALRHRRHYATTGSRLHLAVAVKVPGGAELFEADPAIGGKVSGRVETLDIGDIARHDAHEAEIQFAIHAGSPIERVDVFNGGKKVRSFRPIFQAATSRRLRILWEGSEYRGRGRQTIWDGNLMVSGNAIERLLPINWWNIDKPLTLTGKNQVSWQYLTTGNFGGIELWLDRAEGGEIQLDTSLVKATIQIDAIGGEEMHFEAGGLARRIRIYRLPEENTLRSFEKSASVALTKGRDNPLYVRIRTEDGHLCWSSPIYLIDSPAEASFALVAKAEPAI